MSARKETRGTPKWTPNINIYKLFFKCQIMNESRRILGDRLDATEEASGLHVKKLQNQEARGLA